jgi:signal transduction histidine kinase
MHLCGLRKTIMRLSEFIRLHQPAIITEWEEYARTCPPAPSMSRTELRDNVAGLLEFIANDLEKPQTREEQLAKAKRRPPETTGTNGTAAEEHAEQRFRKGFDTLEMISEFRVLRASIFKLWICPKTDEGIADMVRLNAAIDQAMTVSLQKYMENERRARSLFLGTLIHDLRNPMNAIMQAAQLLRINDRNPEETRLISMIQRSTRRISQLVSELIDAVRIRLGKGIPIAPVVSNLGEIAREVVDEIHLAHPGRNIKATSTGDLVGEWDNVRMGQLISNLVGNAVQHAGQSADIEVTLTGRTEDVSIIVHNTGSSIPADLLPVIFDPLTRGIGNTASQAHSTSLGLGLFIVHEIVAAHNGKISVTSTEKDGTTFKILIPRKFSGKAVAEEDR